jgi:hypothetical protein
MMSDDQLHDDEALIGAVTDASVAGAGRDPLARHLRALRDELCRPPSPSARWNHVAAMRQAARPRRRPGPRGVFTIAVATVGFVGVTTGLAAAGHLPRPAQDRAARIAEVVGLDLPGNEPAGSGPAWVRDRARETRRAPSGTRPPSSSTTAARPGAGGMPPGRSVSAPGTSDDAAPDAASPAMGVDPPPGPPAWPWPGGSGAAPGHAVTGPGNSANAPGHSANGPGNSANAPGHSANGPGNSANAPGHIDPAATLKLVPPGHDPDGPGNSENAPGQLKERGRELLAPGLEYDVPEETTG